MKYTYREVALRNAYAVITKMPLHALLQKRPVWQMGLR